MISHSTSHLTLFHPTLFHPSGHPALGAPVCGHGCSVPHTRGAVSEQQGQCRLRARDGPRMLSAGKGRAGSEGGGQRCIHQRLACFMLLHSLTECPLTLHSCGSLAQVLAVAVSAVTDLWTRRAFVKAVQLQQRQRDATPVSQETDAANAASRKAVKTATTTDSCAASS